MAGSAQESAAISKSRKPFVQVRAGSFCFVGAVALALLDVVAVVRVAEAFIFSSNLLARGVLFVTPAAAAILRFRFSCICKQAIR